MNESIRDIFGRANECFLTPQERERITVLIVEPDNHARSALRQILIANGIHGISDAPSHSQGLRRLEERRITHILFDVRPTDMLAQDFLQMALHLDPSLVAVAISQNPTTDDVFGMLILGALGYIVRPYNATSIDEAISWATKGEPISEAILNAKDRNEALGSFLLTALHALATVKRDAAMFAQARKELPRKIATFRRAAEIARTFCEGGEQKFADVVMELCIELANGPASRLGRVRQKLNRPRDGKKRRREDRYDPVPLATPDAELGGAAPSQLHHTARASATAESERPPTDPLEREVSQG